ncbi:MAG: nuclear transport factor 2 family protein [Caldimonas sp.]
MTESEAATFVNRFEAAWTGRNIAAFISLWHAEGQLRSPIYDRVIHGSEIGALNELLNAAAPHLTWRLLDWTWRGDTVVIEWENSNRYGEQTLTWRGVDKLTLKAAQILEEIVYVDTVPLHAMREGKRFDPLVRMPK